MREPFCSSLERLESRIAPAVAMQILDLDGDGGQDDLRLNTAAATFLYDIALFARAGNDTIAFTGTNNGGSVTYGTAGGVIHDGGVGADKLAIQDCSSCRFSGVTSPRYSPANPGPAFRVPS